MSAIYTNSVWAYRFTLKDPIDGVTPYALTGKTLEMHFKTMPGATKILAATLANGRLTVTGPSNNQLNVTLSESDTVLFPSGYVLFDLLWTNYNTSHPMRLFGGRIRVKPGITILGG